MSYTSTATYSYTVADVEKVMRRFRADLKMIAQTCGELTEKEASDFSDDIELMAKNGYVTKVDVILYENGKEVRAAVYTVNDNGGSLSASAPGGVMWPKVMNGNLKVIASTAASYGASAQATIAAKLKRSWPTVSIDLSHSGLTASGGRNFVSSSYAFERKDFS